LPFIGRVHDVPAEKTWLKFYEWSRKYGPIYQQNMFGSVHVWITSEEIAHELLSKRAATYSDRPMIPNLPNNRYAGEYLALHGHNGKFPVGLNPVEFVVTNYDPQKHGNVSEDLRNK
jgi:hypothetical protein